MADMDSNLEYNADKRRSVARDLERGLINTPPDRFQLNDLALGAMVVIAAILSFTEFSLTAGDWKNLTALTLFMYIITMFVYRNRYSKGMHRGKSDSEYKQALNTYRAKREEVIQKDLVGLVPEFCTYYKKKELREYRESLLSDIEMDYDTYKEKYLMMPREKVMELPISIECKRTILKCNRAKTVRIYPGLILNESGEFNRAKLIGRSGREREKRDKRIQAITRAAYVLFGAAVAFDVIFNFSLMTIAQWIVRMLPILLAIVSGDDGGYCNITVTETNFKRDQSHVIDLFLEYVRSNTVADEAKEEETPTEDTPTNE